jgi:hypothetical protein
MVWPDTYKISQQFFLWSPVMWVLLVEKQWFGIGISCLFWLEDV